MELARSMRRARMPSVIFRSHVWSSVSRKFCATCCVMVEAPIRFSPVPMRVTSWDKARMMPK